MVKLARLSVDDVVLDTCAGSGGFLMEAMETMIKLADDDEDKIKSIKENQLIGFETDNILFSLACSNMFLHGDGRTNMLFRSSLLDLSKEQDKTVFNYIRSLKPTKIIINPPYESGNPIKFTKQAIDFLEPNGKLVIIMPNPTLTQNEKTLTADLLKKAKLDYVIKMPMSIFKEQNRTVYTSIFGFTKTPHHKNDDVVFYELKDDGLVSVQHKGRIDKHKKWKGIENNILDCVFNKKEQNGVCECRKIFINDELVCAGVRENVLTLPNLVRFGDLFDTSVTGTLQSENAEQEGEFDFITAAETWKKHTSYAYDCEAIVYAVGAEGSLGRAHYVNGKFIASTLCLVLTPKDKEKYPIDLEFYAYYLMAIREKLVSALKNGTSKLTIKPLELANYPIEYFDLPTQRDQKKKIKERQSRIVELEKNLSEQRAMVYDGVSNL